MSDHIKVYIQQCFDVCVTMTVVVERNLALEQITSGNSEKTDQLESRLRQVEQEKSRLNAENERLAKRKHGPHYSLVLTYFTATTCQFGCRASMSDSREIISPTIPTLQ